MPAHQMSKFSGSCTNTTQGPIAIWGFTPHMHQLGRHMNAVIQRAGGMMETVFDHDFDFNSQITYPAIPEIVLNPGDTITSTCTFDNETNASVVPMVEYRRLPSSGKQPGATQEKPSRKRCRMERPRRYALDETADASPS